MTIFPTNILLILIGVLILISAAGILFFVLKKDGKQHWTLYVFSDSHGNNANMRSVLRRGLPDAVIFLGDGEADLLPVRQEYPDLTIHQVKGNCDYSSAAPEKLILPFGKRTVFACHGNTYGVAVSADRLISAARNAGADIVLHGHTHIPYTDNIKNIVIMNPGTIGKGNNLTYGKLTISGPSALAEIIPLND